MLLINWICGFGAGVPLVYNLCDILFILQVHPQLSVVLTIFALSAGVSICVTIRFRRAFGVRSMFGGNHFFGNVAANLIYKFVLIF